ncbi:MAG: hypothetical protein GYA24_03010 [Candidatus Lokiarchaeota archaeon]|nr:hypothetical protein [Candidatus Lokiarchaeota archaeon]
MVDDKENSTPRAPRRARNKTNVSFWIDEAVLQRWDTYCTEAGITRTQLIMSAVNDKLIGAVSIRNLTTKIDRLAEIVSEFNPDAETLIAESKRLNTRGRIFEQIYVTRELGLRREDIKGFSSFAIQQALENLENDELIVGDKTGRYWLKEFYPARE